jgi:SpoVK/Ycf46/Vps4 family AAA+-type ATPase
MPSSPALPYASSLEHLEDRARRAALLVAAHIARTPAASLRWEGEIDVSRLAGGSSDGDASPRTRELWREADELEAHIARRVGASTATATATDLPLDRIAQRFGLTSREVDVLVLCCVARIDPRRSAAWSALEVALDPPDVATVIAILARTLGEAVFMRRLFASNGTLLGSALLLADGRRGGDDLLDARLTVPRRVVGELLGDADLPDDLVPFSSVQRPLASLDQVVLPDATKRLVLSLVSHHDVLTARRSAWGIDDVVQYGRGHVLLFAGPPGTGKTMLAHAVAHEMGKRLFTVDAGRLADAGSSIDVALDAVFREARLLDAVLFFDECEQLFASRKLGNQAMPVLLTRLEMLDGVAILATNMDGMLDEALGRRVLARIEFEAPGPSARAEIWRRHLPSRLPLERDVDCERLAEQFDLAGGYIKNAVLAAVTHVVARGAERVSMADLEAAAKLQQRIHGDVTLRTEEPQVSLDDVVIPDEVRARVDRFVRAARARATVLGEWGMGRTLGRGAGLAALLSGPPGTGKSMTAEAIASALGRPLLRCPVAAMLSRWVGDTARRVDEVFATAREHRAVLVFDEADALFARRVDVHTAQDRFANADTGALLDRLERHDGVTILTTNLPCQLDPAFERRLQLRLDVPRPDVRTRVALWRKMLSSDAPLADDVDALRLARAHDLSGAQIRNAVLSAALEAASAPPAERRITHAMLERAAAEQGVTIVEQVLAAGAAHGDGFGSAN